MNQSPKSSGEVMQLELDLKCGRRKKGEQDQKIQWCRRGDYPLEDCEGKEVVGVPC